MENENFHGVHPGAASVAKYCVSTLESHAGGTNVNSLLHTMTLLKDVISVFPKSQIKPACEMVLKIMASGEPRALSCGFQVLYGLFAGRSVQVYRRFGLGVYYRPFHYRRVRRQGSLNHYYFQKVRR